MNKFTIAVTAHNSKKEEIVLFLKAHREELDNIRLVATRDIGQLITGTLQIPVTFVDSRSSGGNRQIGTLIAGQEMDAVIFLSDPTTAHLYEPDLLDLMHLCDAYNIPLATNLAAAEAVLHLLAEHPEALHGHHLIAQYLEDLAPQNQ